MHFELSPSIVWIALWILNTCSEFQVNTFNNQRYHKMSKFDNDDAKATSISRVFSGNSQAKNTIIKYTKQK